MEAKKTPKADLQNKRGLFLEIGLCVALALMIFLFRMNQERRVPQDMGAERAIAEQEMVEITFEDQKPPEVQQQVVEQTTFEILDIVRDDKKIETTLSFADFDPNATFDFQPAETTAEEVVESDEPFLRVESMPQFQGGDVSTFRNWVQSRLTYPAVAAENGVQGTVTAKFVIERDGSLTNIEILGSPDRSLSDEAAKILRTSPKWTPGSNRGIPARVAYTIPIIFRLE